MGGFSRCVLPRATTRNALKRYTAGAPIRELSSERTKWANHPSTIKSQQYYYRSPRGDTEKVCYIVTTSRSYFVRHMTKLTYFISCSKHNFSRSPRINLKICRVVDLMLLFYMITSKLEDSFKKSHFRPQKISAARATGNTPTGILPKK